MIALIRQEPSTPKGCVKACGPGESCGISQFFVNSWPFLGLPCDPLLVSLDPCENEISKGLPSELLVTVIGLGVQFTIRDPDDIAQLLKLCGISIEKGG